METKFSVEGKMSYISKVELKYQLEKMGVKVEGNYIRKKDIKKAIAHSQELIISLQDVVSFKHEVKAKYSIVSVNQKIDYKYFPDAQPIRDMISHSYDAAEKEFEGESYYDVNIALFRTGTPSKGKYAHGTDDLDSGILDWGIEQGSIGYVAYDNKKPIGWAILGINSIKEDDFSEKYKIDEKLIYRLMRFVSPKYRRTGISDELSKLTIGKFIEKNLEYKCLLGVPKKYQSKFKKGTIFEYIAENISSYGDEDKFIRIPGDNKIITYDEFLTRKNIKWRGDLDLCFSKIETLPEGFNVSGNLNVSHTQLKELPTGLNVGKNLNLWGCKIKKIPDDLKVRGNLNIQNCEFLKKLPKSIKVGKEILLYSKKQEQLIDIPDELKNKIKLTNDT